MNTVLPVVFGLAVTAAVLAAPWAAQALRRRFPSRLPRAARGPEPRRGALAARAAPRRTTAVQPSAEPARPFGFDSGVIICDAPAADGEE